MKFLHSIRWRLQLWHALLLVLVLTGFGYTAWRLQWATQVQRVDQELEQRAPVVVDAMRTRATEGRDVSPRKEPPRRQREPNPDRPAPAVPPGREVPLSARDARLFTGDAGSAFYYVVWSQDDREWFRSASAPPDVARPERVAGARGARMSGDCREFFLHLPSGECVLVGRGIRDDLASMRRLAWLLTGAGLAVCALGLLGGWWISTRALRPIADISVTAAKIATGDLTQRIHTADTDSELGQFVGVLNDAFARLQAAFDRQVEFTADASHELRTPLSVVLTQTQTALSRERSVAEYRECLAACHRAAQRMRQLIESLLTLARIDSGEAVATHEPCDLGRIASEAVELLRPLAVEKSVVLELDVAPTLCQGNPAQFAQVANNLVNNAIFYNRPGGVVQVKVAAESDTAILSVRDTGLGIATEDLPHIFERFYRSDKARSGAVGRAGLGLAIARAIVAAHGGTIHVSTARGEGSTFTARLPGISCHS